MIELIRQAMRRAPVAMLILGFAFGVVMTLLAR